MSSEDSSTTMSFDEFEVGEITESVTLSRVFQTTSHVKVYIGEPSERQMRLQTNNSFATTSSQYFRAAFRGGDNGYTFQEAETKEIHLVEDDPRIFGFLVSLRHSGFILCNRCSSRQALTRTFPFDQDIDFLMEVEDFHKLHIFLEKVCLQELSGEVHQHLEGCYDKIEDGVPTDELRQLVYENSTSVPAILLKSLICRKLKSFCCGDCTTIVMREFGTQYEEFTKDLLSQLHFFTLRPL